MSVPLLAGHHTITWGPLREGEHSHGLLVVPMAGWVWVCTCRQAGFGYRDEADARRFAQLHVERETA